MTDVLLCVGNSMMGDDGAGPLLAEMCAANPAGQWVVIDGGSAPENDIVAIRELRPERLLIVDATDMGLNPGDIRIIDPDDIAEMFMMTTHNMPLNYLVDQLKEERRRGDFPRHSAGYRRFLLSDDPAGERGRCPGDQQLAGWQGKGGFTQLEAAND
ncbi:coenzyme F420 hydrogenase maturation protease [Klebsiella pneumoniae]|uniref:Coenzyme F420 hydrogenase maturation protease n=1 Tax=Klebsiella pneumoniae TaxID=573 RepID=A0A2X1RGN3_KLEPN|nr:coenzyme F420 hydrogenase maturation protease [Klebsiella pneumoniae]